MTIPASIHRIWLGKPIPATYVEWGEAWARMHPGWTVRTWAEAGLDDLPMVNRALYDAAESYTADAHRWRADIARLELLYRYGGVYVDCDTEPLRPIDELREHALFLPESANDPRFVTNAVIGAEPKHPFIGLLIEHLAQNVTAYGGRRIVDMVGPLYISRMIERHRPEGVTVLPWRSFAGQSIRDRDAGLEPDLSEAYAWHRWHNTVKEPIR